MCPWIVLIFIVLTLTFITLSVLYSFKNNVPCQLFGKKEKHRRESLCWRIINYTALLQNTNIYTVYTESRVAGAQSNQLQNGNSEGPKTWSQSALSVKLLHSHLRFWFNSDLKYKPDVIKFKVKTKITWTERGHEHIPLQSENSVGYACLSAEAATGSKHPLLAGQRLPMLGKLFSFSGKSSL